MLPLANAWLDTPGHYSLPSAQALCPLITFISIDLVSLSWITCSRRRVGCSPQLVGTVHELGINVAVACPVYPEHSTPRQQYYMGARGAKVTLVITK